MWWCDAGQVQISLIAEAVMWKRGILVMPPVVNQLVKAMQVSPALFALSANVILCQSSMISCPGSGCCLSHREPSLQNIPASVCKQTQTASNA